MSVRMKNNSQSLRESRTKIQRETTGRPPLGKISDTQRAFLARAGGEITLIKKSEERKNPICPLEYYSTELKLSGAGDGLSSS